MVCWNCRLLGVGNHTRKPTGALFAQREVVPTNVNPQVRWLALTYRHRPWQGRLGLLECGNLVVQFLELSSHWGGEHRVRVIGKFDTDVHSVLHLIRHHADDLRDKVPILCDRIKALCRLSAGPRNQEELIDVWEVAVSLKLDVVGASLEQQNPLRVPLLVFGIEPS